MAAWGKATAVTSAQEARNSGDETQARCHSILTNLEEIQGGSSISLALLDVFTHLGSSDSSSLAVTYQSERGDLALFRIHSNVAS